MKELSWKNAQGLKIFGIDWEIKHPKAVLALVHGQGEHIGRYGPVAEWFAQKGIAMMGFDQQGFGRSGGKRGYAACVDVLLDDIGQFLEMVRERYPDTPVFLYGHSLGGGLSLTYVLQRDPIIHGLIATSPYIQLAFKPAPLKVAVGKMMRRIAPKLTLSTGLESRYISHDPKEVAAYDSDPLVHDKVSAAAGIAILEMGNWLNSYSGVFSIPVLLTHGGDDHITSCAATRAFSERVGGSVDYKEWPGLWHEMHHEKERFELFQYLLEWMEPYYSKK